MKRIFYLTTSILISLGIHAQEEYNLVPNWSFEQVDDKIKSGGQITSAYPWKSVTMNPVDLYSADAKNSDFEVPENKYGKEKAKTGQNYAGVSFFGYRGRLPRTYLGTTLREPLEAGKEYCLKFHVSMSDMSKYAVNNIAMHISTEEVTEMSDGNLDLEPHIVSVTRKIYDQQFLWESICGTYKAEGGEKFIIIGNFSSDDDTEQETVRLSREFSGRQTYDAYYFVDDVSVIPTDKIGKKDCACEEIAGGQLSVEYKSFGTDESERASAKKTKFINSDGTAMGEEPKTKPKSENAEAEETNSEEPEEEEEVFSVETTEIYFDTESFEPKKTEQDKIEKVASYLLDNPQNKVEIVGHIDPSETGVKILGRRRAFMMQKQLMDFGVEESRISYSTEKAKQLVSKSDPSKNQRVSFILK